MIEYPKPPFPEQKQPMPGFTAKMNPLPDHGETSYKGAGRLNNKEFPSFDSVSSIGGIIRRVPLPFASHPFSKVTIWPVECA
jgi:hypothetical protein